MSIPLDFKLHEHAVATFYFDDLGILHSISRPGPRSIKIMKDYVAYVKQLTGNKKVQIISNISAASPMDQATRNYTNSELESMFTAMAMISTSPLGKMIGNLLLTLNQPSLPVKIFGNEKEAKQWLMIIKQNENLK